MAINFALCLLFCLLGIANAQYSQIATLYASSGCTGASVKLPANGAYVPDLTSLGFNNRAYSAKLRGPWIFYDIVNYNPTSSSVGYAYGNTEKCFNFGSLAGTTSSVRYAGSQSDYRTDSITFYKKDWYQADQEYVTANKGSLTLGGNIASIIVNGKSAWTVYEKTNFGGKAICLTKAPNTDPAFAADLAKLNPPIAYNFIRSVKKGCLTENVLSVNSVAMSENVQIHMV